MVDGGHLTRLTANHLTFNTYLHFNLGGKCFIFPYTINFFFAFFHEMFSNSSLKSNSISAAGVQSVTYFATNTASDFSSSFLTSQDINNKNHELYQTNSIASPKYWSYKT